MGRGTDKSICHPDQFRGQLYRAVYVDGFTLVQFTDAMEGVFEAIQTISSVKIDIQLGQWQSRKKDWDKEWDIKNGGPSPEVRYELLNQCTWLYKGLDGKPAYKPFNLDSLALSTLPAGLTIATDISNPETQYDTAMAGQDMDKALQVDLCNDPFMGNDWFDRSNHNPPVAPEDSYHPVWPSQTFYDSNNPSITPIHTETLPSLIEDDTIHPNTLFGQQQQHPTMPQHGLRDTYSSTTIQNSPSKDYSSPYDNSARHCYPNTMSRGQAEIVPIQTRDVFRMERNPTNQIAHARRVAAHGWSAPFQPIEQRPRPNLKSNGLDTHLYTGQH